MMIWQKNNKFEKTEQATNQENENILIRINVFKKNQDRVYMQFCMTC
jgi:hypothetical protein